MPKRLLLAALLAILLPARPAPAGGLPFCPGESLTFALSWGVIPAGEASLEVLPPDLPPGADPAAPPRLHLRMRARTNEFVDVFYRVRDQADSWTDPGLTRSEHYEKSQHEGSYHREIVVRFFWSNSTVRYENDVNGPKAPLVLLPGTFDPLSVFYGFRKEDIGPDSAVLLPVTDGTKTVMGEARVVGRERVRVPAGEFDAWVVEPDIRDLGGVFRKSPKAKLTVWVSADARRLPVRIESAVLVGSFRAELTGLAWPEDCPGGP
ncbi:MAG: DUF3108 domain-containing protein [Thermodesulfobacteriota bacterium]